eukprot:3141337-Prymnesium_polylepis.1
MHGLAIGRFSRVATGSADRLSSKGSLRSRSLPLRCYHDTDSLGSAVAEVATDSTLVAHFSLAHLAVVRCAVAAQQPTLEAQNASGWSNCTLYVISVDEHGAEAVRNAEDGVCNGGAQLRCSRGQIPLELEVVEPMLHLLLPRNKYNVKPLRRVACDEQSVK